MASRTRAREVDEAERLPEAHGVAVGGDRAAAAALRGHVPRARRAEAHELLAHEGDGERLPWSSSRSIRPHGAAPVALGDDEPAVGGAQGDGVARRDDSCAPDPLHREHRRGNDPVLRGGEAAAARRRQEAAVVHLQRDRVAVPGERVPPRAVEEAERLPRADAAPVREDLAPAAALGDQLAAVARRECHQQHHRRHLRAQP
ncbi:hypothetical protein [Agrococcus sp. UYP10]|uniref:hypothetical protein n=1 Tax=Agrococcus sp. UYP10 TaxID=1756355 RepID=UPI0033947564